MKNIILLGSTGSIGTNVLNVARLYPDRFRIKAISTRSNYKALIRQAREFSPDIVSIVEERFYGEVKRNVPAGTKVVAGAGSVEELAGKKTKDIIFISISGIAALKPVFYALRSGNTVALASKEPIVSAGSLLKDIAAKNASRIIPVDSEHSAITQCLCGRSSSDVSRLYITGSGGSLRKEPVRKFNSFTVRKILDHPKWDMGPKITVDSATLMNKGLEVIEARWLFDISSEKIKVIIQPEAIIHAMVEFIDGTVTAGLFCPDMKFPILKALAFPGVIKNDFRRIDFSDIGGLSFHEPDTKKFPALELAYYALKKGGTLPAVLNGANETAVKLFLDGKIKFTEIIESVEKIVQKHKIIKDPGLDQIIDSEKWACGEVYRLC